MDIKLSPTKLEFFITTAISALDKLDKTDDLRIDTSSSFSTSYSYSGVVASGRRVTYTIYFSKDGEKLKISSLSASGDGKVSYRFTGSEHKKLVNNLTSKLFTKVFEIENAEFKKVFPGYDDTEERNEKLAELLGTGEETKQEETKQENKENINTEEQPEKKKWWQF